MYPTLIDFGPFAIHSFGFMIMLGFLTATWLMRKEFERKGIDPELASNVGIAAIIGGFIGARIYFILERPSEFMADPAGMIFSGAGLVWYGGFIGGFAAVIWIIKRSGTPILAAGDTIMPLLVLGYAIGRIGCQLAGDGDYGPPSDVPWAMAYPEGVVPTTERVHPTPVYDTLLAGSFFAMIWLNRFRMTKMGVAMGWGMVAMGVERFITEFFRTTPVVFAGLTLAQIISLFTMTAGLYLVFRESEEYSEGAALQKPTSKPKKKKASR